MQNFPSPSSEPGRSSGPPGVRLDSERGFQELQVAIPCEGAAITADLIVPPWAQGVVLMAHGAGSSRHSPRSQFVAGKLQAAHMATLVLDLLTEAEESEAAATGNWRFDLDVQTGRLIEATRWVRRHPKAGRLGIGYYGASTGAATALVSAAKVGPLVRAVVSRGGRLDLTGQVLPLVSSPTLLIVGESDGQMLPVNRGAMLRLRCPKELAVVPKATHLFEEPGTLEEVATLATKWFQHHLLTGGGKNETGAAITA